MAKTRQIIVTFPDHTQATRQTDRIYTHAVKSKDDHNNGTIRWCGRPDLMLKTKRKYKDRLVGVITWDPWIAHPIEAPKNFKPYDLKTGQIL